MRNKHVRKSRVFRKARHTAEQPELLPPSLEDLVPEGHLARCLKQILDELDFSGTLVLYDDKGGYAYPPKMMLGVLLFALMDGERSSRRIQDHCRYDVRYRYLSQGLEPDDRSICRFRRRLEPVLPDLFVQVLDLARDRGLLKMKVVAVDGTKVAGSVSQWRRVLKKAEEEDKEIADPDSRLMVSGKGSLQGYNAQAAVDAQTGMVVSALVSQEGADYKTLEATVEEIEANLKEVPKKLVADKGYESATNVACLEEKGIAPYICPREKRDFWKIDEEGKVVCPEGHEPVYLAHYKWRGQMRTQLSVRQCPACPKRESCHKSKFKCLSHPEHLDPRAKIRNDARCRSPEGKQILKLRRGSIETVFGQLKWNKGFQRFRHRGLAAVQSEFRLECLALNLRKVMRAALWRLKALYSVTFHGKATTRTTLRSIT